MKKFLLIIICIIVLGLAGFISFSPMFERVPPVVKVYSNNSYWNLKSGLKIEITDNTGIKSVDIRFDRFTMHKDCNGKKKLVINLKIPRRLHLSEGKHILKITAIDISKWQVFAGNMTRKKIAISVDKRKPLLNVLSHSYGIGRGGAALVIFKATDKNLDKSLVIVNDKYTFKVFPYKKKGYFITLISWPVKEEKFKAVVVAKDKASNKSMQYLNFFHKKYVYKLSKITLNQNFLDNKVKEILNSADYEIPEDFLARFKLMNENLRNQNETKLENITRSFPVNLINNFKIIPFHPLKNAARKASFGDHRYYFFNNKKISESWHLGVDLASIKNAPIKLNNNGKVVYGKFTGIYGNTLIVYHGLGLYSLYAHCSTFLVSEGAEVKKGTVIAKTGATGAVFGDHLHFAILIQGIESQPLEWFDPHWIKDNIVKVMNSAYIE
jgi:murein DD-endopeptidase MepM/ murein hydrolase activator NlpD